MGGGKTTTSTQSVQIPPEVLARYNAVNARAENVANQPFMQYPGQFVAGLTPTQQAGVQGTSMAAGLAQPFFGAGTGMTLQGSQAVGPLTRSQIGYYQDPYTEAVVQPTLAALRQQQGMERAQQQTQAIRSGAFGGDRSGIERANLARQQALGTAQAIAPLYSQGYQTGLQTAAGQQGVIAQDLQRRLAGGQQIAALGTGAQQAALQGAQAQIGAGTLEQQTQQADMTARYQQFLQERGYPFQVAQFLANIAMGTGALSGSTTTSTQPAGFFSDRRLKEDAEPIGKTFDGQTIYRYKYKGDNRTQIGLMADEVQRKHPEAVGLAGGYKTVDYQDATDDAARAKKAGGGLVGADDIRAILEAQRAGFGPFGGGVYGGSGEGNPMSKAGAGYVPAGKLPVPKLATAAGLGAQRPSGISEAAQTGRNIADLAKMGRAGLFGEAPTREDPQGSRGLVGAQGKVGTKGGFLTGGLGGTTTTTPAPASTPTTPPRPAATTTTTRPAGGAAGAAAPEAVKTASMDFEGLGAMPEGMDNLSSVMMASAGGVVPRGYAAGGGINPYDQSKSGDMDYFPEEVLEEGKDKYEMLKPGQPPSAGGRGRSGAGEAMNMAGTLASMIPGVGPVIGTGMKMASMFMADGGAVDNAFAYGGLVPRKGYATEGAVEGEVVEQPKFVLDMDRAKAAIARNESGGRYDAIGPVTERGDQAYGKYQVMGANIPEWTERAVGRRMTPQEFLADKEAQEKVFETEFGRTAAQYGNPYDAASIWFSGKPVAEAGNRRDILKTTVPAYLARFREAYEGNADIPTGKPVSYEGGLGGGRSIDRASSIGDVFDKIMPEGVPTSSSFWAPALGFVGSMLASQRPTLGGALGEGLVGGVSAYQTERQQQAQLAKGVIDLLKERFTRTVDAKGQTIFRDNFTGQVVNPLQLKQAGASMLEARGINPASFGFGDVGGAPAAPGLAAPGAPTAPEAPKLQDKTAAAPAPGAPPTEGRVPSKSWMDKPPGEANLLDKGQTELQAYAERHKDYYGLIGDRDPTVLRQEIEDHKTRSFALSQQGNTAEAKLEEERGSDKQRRLDGYLKEAVAYQVGINQKRAEELQKNASKYETDAETRLVNYKTARDALVRLADIYAGYQSGRLTNYLAEIGGALQTLGVSDPRIVQGTASFDEAMKSALTLAFTKIGDQNLSRAPKASLEKEVQAVPAPSLAPGAVYALIGREIGHLDYMKQKDAAYVDNYSGTRPGKFILMYERENPNAVEKAIAKAYSEIPLPKGETGKTVESLKTTYGKFGYTPRLAQRPDEVPAAAPQRPSGQRPAAAPQRSLDEDMMPGFGDSTVPAKTAPQRPTLQQFLERAIPANPGVSREQLTDYYRQNYGGQ